MIFNFILLVIGFFLFYMPLNLYFILMLSFLAFWSFLRYEDGDITC